MRCVSAGRCQQWGLFQNKVVSFVALGNFLRVVPSSPSQSTVLPGFSWLQESGSVFRTLMT